MEKIKKNYVLLTGCTGSLGSFILKNLICETKDIICLLIRDKNYSSLQVKELLTKFLKINLDDLSIRRRLKYLYGDVSQSNLGLKKREYVYLCKNLNHIYHCAALTNLRSSFEELSLQNILGTKNILKLANNCSQLKSLNYISSMFIAGNFKRKFTENSFWVNQKFNNFYEESKFKAEGLVRKNFNSLYNSFIYRPSVIMGDSHYGHILKPSNLYLTIYLFKNKTFDFIPLNVSTKLNIVPVDLAANAIFLLSRAESGNVVFNICTPKDVNLGILLKKASLILKYKNPKFISLKNNSINDLTPAQRMLLRPMFSYLNYYGKFHAEITNNKLKKYGFHWCNIDDRYFQKIFKYTNKIYNSPNAIS